MFGKWLLTFADKKHYFMDEFVNWGSNQALCGIDVAMIPKQEKQDSQKGLVVNDRCEKCNKLNWERWRRCGL